MNMVVLIDTCAIIHIMYIGQFHLLQALRYYLQFQGITLKGV